MSLRIFGAIDLSASGLRGQRTKLEVVSENIANAETTRTEEGGPYRRKRVVMEAAGNETAKRIPSPYQDANFSSLLRTHESHLRPSGLGQELSLPQGSTVDVSEALDAGRFKQIYDPGHPDADEEGYVLLPNVNVVSEMVDMIAATRAYEANVSAIESAKDMFLQALEI